MFNKQNFLKNYAFQTTRKLIWKSIPNKYNLKFCFANFIYIRHTYCKSKETPCDLAWSFFLIKFLDTIVYFEHLHHLTNLDPYFFIFNLQELSRHQSENFYGNFRNIFKPNVDNSPWLISSSDLIQTFLCNELCVKKVGDTFNLISLMT